MILVIDLGSSSTRAALFENADARAPITSARRSFSFSVDEHGRSEDDPAAALQRLVDVIDALAPAAAGLPAVTHIGFSCYATSLLCLDAQRAPLTPVFTYADTRSAHDARLLRGAHSEFAVLQRTGCRIRANYWPARLAWLRHAQPAVFERTQGFVSLSDFLIHNLTGVWCTGLSVAAWTGLINRDTRDWDATWLAALGLRREQLSPVLAADADLPALAPAWAARWPWLREARMLPPIGDGAAANVGSDCVDRSRVAVTIGTTAAMRVVAPVVPGAAPALPPALWNYFVDHTHALIGGATTEGGNVFAWAQQTLRLPDGAALEQALAAQEPDAHGLTVLPTFAGERSPGYAEDIRATLHGLSLKTTPVDIVRACMEAIAVRLSTINDALRADGMADRDAMLVASGGALEQSPVWCQMIADACGAPLVLADTAEATSAGVARVAAWRFAETRSTSAAGRAFVPNPRYTPVYRAARERLNALYAQVVSDAH